MRLNFYNCNGMVSTMNPKPGCRDYFPTSFRARPAGSVTVP